MIKSNFSEVALLCNVPIKMQCEQGFIILHMPTIQDEYGSLYDCNFFFNCCVKTIAELQTELNLSQLKTKLELIKAICSDSTEISFGIMQCLNMIISDFKYVDDSFYSGETLIIDEIFDIICDYVAVAIGGINMSEVKKKKELANLSPEERAWEERKRMHESKIRKSKNKAGKLISLDIILACLTYEFHISLQDLYEMNKYTVYFLYSQVGKISNYEVTKIAAGTGNLGSKNKHTYWAK